MFNSKLRKGQSIVEYTVILGLVVAALTTMQVYVRRGIQAGIKIAADELGPQEDAGETDPQKGTKSASDINTKTTSTQRTRLFKGGSQRTDIDRISVSSGIAVYGKGEAEKLPTPPTTPPVMPPSEIEWPEEKVSHEDLPPPYPWYDSRTGLPYSY